MACANPNFLADANDGGNPGPIGYGASTLPAAPPASAMQRRIDELESFVQALAHDASSLTRGIGLRAELLRERIGGGDAADTLALVDGIAERADRLGRMTDALLRLARLGMADLQRDEIDLSALAAEIVGELRRDHPDPAVDCVIRPGMTGRGDAALVRLLLENLLGNAWKYTARSAAPRIEFGCRSNGTETVHYITDNGIGLPAETSAALFSPFVRLAAAKSFPGTGLGLAIARQIVERHGGWIRTDDTAAPGATFVFSIGPGANVIQVPGAA